MPTSFVVTHGKKQKLSRMPERSYSLRFATSNLCYTALPSIGEAIVRHSSEIENRKSNELFKEWNEDDEYYKHNFDLIKMRHPLCKRFSRTEPSTGKTYRSVIADVTELESFLFIGSPALMQCRKHYSFTDL